MLANPVYNLYGDGMQTMSIDNLEAYLKRQNTAQLIEDEAVASRREVAYERIKDALQHANLVAGEPLSETRLSRILGISRTPVREALQQLAIEGLVQVIPGQAVTVASRSLPDVLNVVHMRHLLEPELARLVAENCTDEIAAGLNAAVQRMFAALEAADYAAWSRANSDYHTLMSGACPNDLLGETVLQMCNRVHHLANTDSQTNPQRLVACTQEHQTVVDAIAARDADAAAEAMRVHLDALRDSLFRRLSYGR